MPRSAGAERGCGREVTRGSVSLSGGNASCFYFTLFLDFGATSDVDLPTSPSPHPLDTRAHY